MAFDFVWWRRIVCEMLASFSLIFFALCTAIVNNGEAAVTSIVCGCLLIALIYAFGPISGCNIDPAVSLGVLIMGGLSLFDFVFYVIAQFVGGLIASFALMGVLATTDIKWTDVGYSLGENGIKFAGVNKSALGMNLAGGILVEVIMTFFFVMIVLVVTSKNWPNSDKAGFIIGATLTILMAMSLKLTGGSLNPARSFGPAIAILVTGRTQAIAQFWVFLLAPSVGGALAALFCRYFLLMDPNPCSPSPSLPSPSPSSSLETKEVNQVCKSETDQAQQAINQQWQQPQLQQHHKQHQHLQLLLDLEGKSPPVGSDNDSDTCSERINENTNNLSEMSTGSRGSHSNSGGNSSKNSSSSSVCGNEDVTVGNYRLRKPKQSQQRRSLELETERIQSPRMQKEWEGGGGGGRGGGGEREEAGAEEEIHLKRVSTTSPSNRPNHDIDGPSTARSKRPRWAKNKNTAAASRNNPVHVHEQQQQQLLQQAQAQAQVLQPALGLQGQGLQAMAAGALREELIEDIDRGAIASSYVSAAE